MEQLTKKEGCLLTSVMLWDYSGKVSTTVCFTVCFEGQNVSKFTTYIGMYQETSEKAFDAQEFSSLFM